MYNSASGGFVLWLIVRVLICRGSVTGATIHWDKWTKDILQNATLVTSEGIVTSQVTNMHLHCCTGTI